MPSADIDPDCPSSTDSSTLSALRMFANINVFASVLAAVLIWAYFGQTEIPGDPFTSAGAAYDLSVTNWTAVGIGGVVLLQGVFSAIVLHAFANIAEDVTGIRISARAAAILARRT